MPCHSDSIIFFIVVGFLYHKGKAVVLKMIATMENYLLRGQRKLSKLALDPRIQSCARVAAYGGSGFFLSAASLSGGFQPLAMGLISVMTGWRVLVTAAGAVAGYRLFWASAGMQEVVWASTPRHKLVLLAG